MDAPGELQRVKTRAAEFERLYQYMQGRAPAARRYPTIWPRYSQAMQRAAQTRDQLAGVMGMADDGYHYAQAALGQETIQAGLGFWPLLIAGGGMAVLALLGPPAIQLVTVTKCIERADAIKASNPGMSDEEASRIACPEQYSLSWDDNLAAIVKWGVLGVGGIYLLSWLNKRKPERRKAQRRRR